MPEETLLNEGGVTVTSSRFMVPGNTYAMSGVTSVKSRQRNPIKGPVVIGVIGLLMIIGGTSAGEGGGVIFGLLIVGAAIAWAILGAKYLVILNSASGEAEALVSRNRDFVQRVIDALNNAIVSRG